jgi:hypothetical protein
MDNNNRTGKDWLNAVKAYHEHEYRSHIAFLDSVHAIDYGLGPNDGREFRWAVQGFEKKWQTAARAYIEGKFTTPKQFVSSGKFLNLGFVPSREHMTVLGYAIKFYDEDARYRREAGNSVVTTSGRYGSTSKATHSGSKSRMSRTVSGIEKRTFEGRGVPALVNVHISDDLSADSSSRLSDDRSEISQDFGKPKGYAVSERYREISIEKSDFARVLFCELSIDRPHRNSVDAIVFIVFAIIPLLLFAKLREMLASFLPIESSPVKNHVPPENVEDEWTELRANALMLNERYEY